MLKVKKSEAPVSRNKVEKENKTSPAKYFFGGFLSASLISMLLLLIFSAGFYFNIGDFKGKAIQFLQIEKEQQRRLAYRENELNKMIEEIDFSMNELKADQKIHEQRIKKMEEKENELIELESKLSGEQIEISNVLAIYNEMDPKQASEILSLNPKSPDTAIIIKNLSEKKAAAILSLMKPEIASLILEIANK